MHWFWGILGALLALVNETKARQARLEAAF